MNNPALTVTLREGDRPDRCMTRINRLVQHAAQNDDINIPVEGGDISSLISSAQSYLKGTYDIELRLVGYTPSELGVRQEWVLAVRTWASVGGYTTKTVGYDPLA